MPIYEVDLDDGRTVEVQAMNARDASSKRKRLNDNLRANKDWQRDAAVPEQVGSMEAFMLGAGRETDKLLSGVEDLFYGATGNIAAADSLREQQALNDEAFANVQEQAPIASALGGVLPYLAAPAASAPATIAMAAGMGGARYGDERTETALKDAAMAALPFGAGRAYRAIRPRLMDPGAGKAMVSRADDIGWPLSPGDRTGNKALKTIESGIDATPMPFNPMHRMYSQRNKILNTRAANAIGESTDTITDDVLGSAADRIKGDFESMGLERGIPVDDSFAGRLVEIQDESRKRMFVDNEISDVIDYVFDQVGRDGMINPADYQAMTSQLKGKIDQVFKGKAHSIDPDFGKSLDAIVEALDDVAEQGMSGDALNRLQKARAQWKALRAVEKGYKESGDISGPLLANELKRSDKGGYLRGRNKSPLYETARMSKAFPARPDSGTAGRLAMSPQGLMSMAMSPFNSLAANAYMLGTGIPTRYGGALMERAPMLGPEALSARFLASIDEEDEKHARLAPSR